MFKTKLGRQKTTAIRSTFSVLTLMIAILLPTSVFGQSSNEKLIQALVEKNVLSQSDADQLLSTEAPKSLNPIEKAQNFVRKGLTNTPYLSIGGYGKLMYQYNSQSSIKNELRPRVVFLWLEGKLTDHLRYFVMYDFVAPALYEYYAEWMPSKAFKLKGGQMKVPFTLENPISLVNLEGVQNTRTISSLAGMSADVGVNNGGGRDIGIQASGSLANIGDHDLIQYAAGVFEGVGINARENNNVKDFAGTLTFQPINGWKLAAGVYAGQALYTKSGESTSLNHVRNRWALSTEYTQDRVYARAEYVKGNDAGITRDGIYGTGTYYFVPKKFNSFVRVDHYNSDKSTQKSVTDYAVGANYYIAPNCRFELDYQYSDYSKEWTAHQDTHMILSELQLYF